MIPNEASLPRPTGAVHVAQNDGWQPPSRDLLPEAPARIDTEKIALGSQQHNESRPIMPSGHRGHHTTTADLTRPLPVHCNRTAPGLCCPFRFAAVRDGGHAAIGPSPLEKNRARVQGAMLRSPAPRGGA